MASDNLSGIGDAILKASAAYAEALAAWRGLFLR
jgi:hypothetical protein